MKKVDTIYLPNAPFESLGVKESLKLCRKFNKLRSYKEKVDFIFEHTGFDGLFKRYAFKNRDDGKVYVYGLEIWEGRQEVVDKIFPLEVSSQFESSKLDLYERLQQCSNDDDKANLFEVELNYLRNLVKKGEEISISPQVDNDSKDHLYHELHLLYLGYICEARKTNTQLAFTAKDHMSIIRAAVGGYAYRKEKFILEQLSLLKGSEENAVVEQNLPGKSEARKKLLLFREFGLLDLLVEKLWINKQGHLNDKELSKLISIMIGEKEETVYKDLFLIYNNAEGSKDRPINEGSVKRIEKILAEFRLMPANLPIKGSKMRNKKKD